MSGKLKRDKPSKKSESQVGPGRPSDFNDKVADKILELAEKGKTDKQIAEIIGVHERTLHRWKGRHVDFRHALAESKQIADELVEASLWSRAVGYTHESEKIFCDKGDVIRATTLEHYPPDVGAAKHWLANRQPERWGKGADSPVNNINNNVTVNLSDEELDRLIAEKQRKVGMKETRD